MPPGVLLKHAATHAFPRFLDWSPPATRPPCTSHSQHAELEAEYTRKHDVYFAVSTCAGCCSCTSVLVALFFMVQVAWGAGLSACFNLELGAAFFGF